MKSDFAAITIAPKSEISLARATAVSFQAQNPDVPIFLLLTDEFEGLIEVGQEPFSEIFTLDQLHIDQLERFRFHYDRQELSYAATPYAIEHVLNQGFKAVLFLKRETMVLDSVLSEFEAMRGCSLALTAHFLKPPSCEDPIQWELNVLCAGVFNGGVVFVGSDETSRSFLSWWKQRTFYNCLRQIEDGLHFEQRWLDLAPSLVPGTRIIRDPGINVGHWNLEDRELEIQDGKLTAQGVPCRIFRFSGYEPEFPGRTSKYHPDQLVDATEARSWVFERYRNLLLEMGYHETKDWSYAYDRFDNGSVVNAGHRSLYRLQGEQARRFGDPLKTAGEQSFWKWMQTRGD